MNVVKEVRHGREVFVSKYAEPQREEGCLCLHCADLKVCPVAATLYSICKTSDLAMTITRCPVWAEEASK